MMGGIGRVFICFSVFTLCSCSHDKYCSLSRAKQIGFDISKKRNPKAAYSIDNSDVQESEQSWKIEYMMANAIGGGVVVTINKSDCSVENIMDSQ